jgi:hypothetical protein
MTERDKIMHKALLKVLAEADFTLKAREVGTFLQVYNWVQKMPNNWVSVKDKKLEENKPKTTRKKKA